jgi:cytochrome P450
VGGTNTYATTLEWALSKLIHHLEIMKRAHEELDRVVGKNRLMNELNLPNLPYLHAIIKKNFHLYPIVPLVIAHFNLKDTQIANYKILAKMIIFVNTWAIGPNSKAWKKPLEFNLDRFSNLTLMLEGKIITFCHLDQVVNNA